MWLSKLNDMSVGPLWVLREQPATATQPPPGCAVCGRGWLESQAQQSEVLIVLAEPITDPVQQALLDNCIRAAGWSDVADCLTLHAGCGSDVTAGLGALQQQLTGTPVRRVIVFGEDAAQRINPEFRRGARLEFQQSVLVVTHHPAQLLANPALKAQTWSDLCLALHDA